jgi:hypothetical protein
VLDLTIVLPKKATLQEPCNTIFRLFRAELQGFLQGFAGLRRPTDIKDFERLVGVAGFEPATPRPDRGPLNTGQVEPDPQTP